MNVPSCLTSLWIRRRLVSVRIWTLQAHSVHIDVFWSCPNKAFHFAYMCLALDLDPGRWRLYPCSWPCCCASGFLFSYFLFRLFAWVLSSPNLSLVVLQFLWCSERCVQAHIDGTWKELPLARQARGSVGRVQLQFQVFGCLPYRAPFIYASPSYCR